MRKNLEYRWENSSFLQKFVPAEAKTQAQNAVEALGLDFGAVDIILGKNGIWYVLEVNTACGLEGTTLEKYCEQFRKFI